MARAVSCSSGSMIGATAAMADPPQIAVPAPIKLRSLSPTLSRRPNTYAVTKAAAMVMMVTHSESNPARTTGLKLRPKPSKIIDHCKTALEAKVNPGWQIGITPMVLRIPQPNKIAHTGRPTVGNQLPNTVATTATRAASAIPYQRDGPRGTLD